MYISKCRLYLDILFVFFVQNFSFYIFVPICRIINTQRFCLHAAGRETYAYIFINTSSPFGTALLSCAFYYALSPHLKTCVTFPAAALRLFCSLFCPAILALIFLQGKISFPSIKVTFYLTLLL